MTKNENRYLYYNGNKLEYNIQRKKIKNIYICIQKNNIIIKAPLKARNEQINNLLERKSEWIYKTLKKQENKIDRNLNLQLRYFYLLDNKISIRYNFKNIKNIEVNIDKDCCNVDIPQSMKNDNMLYNKIEAKIDKEIKKIASKEISSIMERYIALTKLVPKSYSIKKFKRIWGNCSSKGDIKINQNIIWHSRKEIEYVCLHELCHLKYMNHKKQFWKLVEKYMPDYKNSAKILKES